MSFQEYLNSPDFRRQSNAVTESGGKFVGSVLTDGFMAVLNFIKSMVLMAFGK